MYSFFKVKEKAAMVQFISVYVYEKAACQILTIHELCQAAILARDAVETFSVHHFCFL